MTQEKVVFKLIKNLHSYIYRYSYIGQCSYNTYKNNCLYLIAVGVVIFSDLLTYVSSKLNNFISLNMT